MTGGKQIKGLLLSISLADRLDEMKKLEYVRARSFVFVCEIVLLVFPSHDTMSILLILKNFHKRILTLSSQVCTSCIVFPLECVQNK